MSSNRNSSSSGIGICGVLTIVFVVLKLVGVINWSWLSAELLLWQSMLKKYHFCPRQYRLERDRHSRLQLEMWEWHHSFSSGLHLLSTQLLYRAFPIMCRLVYIKNRYRFIYNM